MEKRKGRVQLVLVAVFVVLSLVVAGQVSDYNTEEISRDGAKEAELLVEFEELELADYQVEVNSTGVINYRNYIDVVSQVEGRVKMVSENFYQGAGFESGEVLFALKESDFVFDEAQAYANFVDLQRKYEFEKAKTDVAILEWQRFNPDLKPNDLVSNRKNLQAAKAAMDGSKAQLDKARLNLDRTSFKYDFDGRVIENNIEVGAFINKGQVYGRVYDVNSMQINSNVSFDELRDLGDWQEILVKIDGKINGKIERIGAVLDQRTRFVDLFIKSKNYGFLPGQIVDVKLIGKEFEDVWVIDKDYVDKDGYIWVIDEENRAKKLMVEALFENEMAVIIRPKNEFKKIISSSFLNLVDGVKVGM